MTEVKICGLTGPEDIQAVNAVGADYAGFVLYEPSKRYVTLASACELKEGLAPGIRSVAVCVSPEEETLSRIDAAGFDRIQIHGSVTPKLLNKMRTPVWQAINLSDSAQLEQILLHPRIVGYLIDGADFGGGETFGWEQAAEGPAESAKQAAGDPAKNTEQPAGDPAESAKQPAGDLAEDPKHVAVPERLREEIRAHIGGKCFILAGGLTADNVREGIRLFAPDVVDVSSGVEWSMAVAADGGGQTERTPATAGGGDRSESAPAAAGGGVRTERAAAAAGGGDRTDPAAGVAGGDGRTESTARVRGGRKDPEKLMAFVREVREA